MYAYQFTQVSIFSLLRWAMCFKNGGVLSFWPDLLPVSRGFNVLNYSLSTPKKLSRLPQRPPHLSSRLSNACPILTSFALPTGHWFSTRPGKSNYTGVREVDFPIMDSMLRMRADDNTHVTALITLHSLLLFILHPFHCRPSLFISLCS